MKKIPKFASEAEEREFWASADSTKYVEWKGARTAVFPKLRPSLRTISLRLPEMLLEEIKVLANKRDVPYQSLLKLYLAERVDQELKKANGRGRRSNSALQRARAARR
jgi:predicted DNA binding CopG/RHH family protein